MLRSLLPLSGHELGNSTTEIATGIGRKQTHLITDRADGSIKFGVSVWGEVFGTSGQEVLDVAHSHVKKKELGSRFLETSKTFRRDYLFKLS